MTFFDPGVTFGWAAPVITIVAAIFMARAQGKVSRANAEVATAQAKTHTAEIWEAEAQAIRARADRLQDENKLLLESNTQLSAELSRLRSLPDLTGIMKALVEQQNQGADRYAEAMARITTLFDAHEERAAERHKQAIQAFGHLTQGMSGMMETMGAMQAGMVDLIERVNGGGDWDGATERRSGDESRRK